MSIVERWERARDMNKRAEGSRSDGLSSPSLRGDNNLLVLYKA